MEDTTAKKRPRTEEGEGSATGLPQLTIGTHDGTFHCDEALACFLLKLLPEYRNANIVRTRDAEKLAKCDIVVDVGGEYVPERHRYDHHQRGFTEKLDDKHKTKLSSAGLIYKHFGHRVIANELATDATTTETLFQELYKTFVEALDAIDNGISQYGDGSLTANYQNNTSLPSRVGHFNPPWNDAVQDFDAGFKKASELAGKEFLEALHHLHNTWLPARSLVEKALAARDAIFETTDSEIMLLEQSCPWKGHLFELEKELNIAKPIKYVLFPDSAGSWRVQAVPIAPDSFANRLSLPEPWCGLRDAQLSAATGIDGCIFIHASGFIGGCKTQEGAKALAKKALTFSS